MPFNDQFVGALPAAKICFKLRNDMLEEKIKKQLKMVQVAEVGNNLFFTGRSK